MNPWVIVGIVISWVGLYAAGRIEQHIADKAFQAKDEHVAEVATKAAVMASAQAIAGIKIQHQTIQQKIRTEVIREPVFTNPDCSVPVPSRGVLDAAIAGRPLPGDGADVPGKPPAP